MSPEPNDHGKTAPQAEQRIDPIQAREYKLLLNQDRFREHHALHKFWKLAHHAAGNVGIEIGNFDDPPEPRIRDVEFFDTPHFKLYENGFILRRRGGYKHGIPQSSYEVVLKFRHPDRATAAKTDVRPLLPCNHLIKFKEEILPPHDDAIGMRRIYSHNCELDTPHESLLRNFHTTEQVFPVLQHIGANSKIALVQVHGAVIEERLHQICELDFGGKLNAKATVAVWRVRTAEDPMVAEFSFQLKFDRLQDAHRKPLERSELFYTGIQSAASDWIQRATTKTALVYGLGHAAVHHHE
ncbi:MAG: hypothetical protein ACREQB_09620 [Candidatus Binataceae bacterium]